ncbi:unnamed protein product [Pseudo-nitzschia multistriata]|uniref:U-box domain-containing protein n=1 Tax=Pseudo-nitzschia multistriata TaxID=183589 RepID=A0A448YZM3_9STRA|nr:unnamed protein product [Pseudo-nitzschia multistriata]
MDDSTRFSTGFASLPATASTAGENENDPDLLPDPDEGFVLFPEDEPSGDPSTSFPDATKPDHYYPSKSQCAHGDDEEEQHILGTIIVRVVAARGLDEPPHHQRETGGLRGVFRQSQAPATNPYASLKFGSTTQRTSELYSTLDPVWPRDEVFFMDVSLPVSQLTHSAETPLSSSSSSSEEVHHEDAAPEALDDPFYSYQKPDNTALTVAIFHSESGSNNLGKHKHKDKLGEGGTVSGDSDDAFLGMASIDLAALFTGMVPELDEWVPLHGTASDHHHVGHQEHYRSSNRHRTTRGAAVRIVCEYEPSDAPPKPGDICRFTKFCHPRDLYPLEPSRSYKVDTVRGNGTAVILSYESPEGWLLSFQAHRNMLFTEERHVSPLNTAQDELQTLGERLAVSPLIAAVTETAERVLDDGLVGIAGEIVKGSAFVFDRWFRGGVDTVIRDLRDVTNLDGRHNQDAIGESLEIGLGSSASLDDASDDGVDNAESCAEHEPAALDPIEEQQGEALPNMPPCPITGFPMVDPVVAADGHTYERRAIRRWLGTSDKSPMTGSVLLHKELVPNYGLLSSIEEAATREDNNRESYLASSFDTHVLVDSDDERKPPPNTDANAHA